MDLVEFAVTVVLAGLAVAWRSRLEGWAAVLAQNTRWSMAAVGMLPIVLRLGLLAEHPIPAPAVSDDFSYLLLADTLAHLRLANPVHPLHQFFETYFVLQEPSYSSIFPLGQGIVLAIGEVLFRNAWAGVALSVGLFCALCYWMLRGWTTPGWAMAGGVLAAIEFGPLNQWMNSYWGGAVSACAGCLVFGALPRMRAGGRTRDRLLFGTGLAIQVLTRPYEFLFLGAGAVVYLQVKEWRRAWIWMAPVAGAVILTLCQNRAVTGSSTTLPYQLSRYQYGVPAAFTFEPNPVPHRTLTPQQELDYRAQSAVHDEGTDTTGSYLSRLVFRVRYYRFFFLPALYLALPFFVFALAELRFVWVTATLVLFALGTNFYPYFYSHYIAAVTSLFVLVSVTALERLSRFSTQAAQLILIFCFAHFLFWYGAQAVTAPVTRYEAWDAINHGDPEGRIAIQGKLAAAAGRQLVFVRYGPRHGFEEWVHNEADIDRSRVVWARDLGAEEDGKLLRYYPDRAAWLLEPDAHPPKLTPYTQR